MTTSRSILACSRWRGVSITRPAESSSVSVAVEWKSRLSSRACAENGFIPSSAAVVSVAYVASGYSEMQGSGPRTRNTLPARAARNLAGTVSRFWASSECSKVRWKAKAHVGSEEGVQSIPGGGVGGAPPPGTGFANGTYPTPSHSATQISSFIPLDLNLVTLRTRNRRISRSFLRWADPCRRPAHLQHRLQSRRLQAELRGMDRSPMLRAAVFAVLVALVAGCGSGAAGGDA